MVAVTKFAVAPGVEALHSGVSGEDDTVEVICGLRVDHGRFPLEQSLHDAVYDGEDEVDGGEA